MESAKLLVTEFSTAGAEYPEIHQTEGDVILRFKDWREQPVEVFFSDPIAFKWQMAICLSQNERDDSCYEILESEWLALHIKEEEVSASEEYVHYKFNFNECGQFEIISPRFTAKT
mgnify:CR=1 FL=1